jgi:hypothetical protein
MASSSSSSAAASVAPAQPHPPKKTRNFFFLALNNPVAYSGTKISGYCVVLVIFIIIPLFA